MESASVAAHSIRAFMMDFHYEQWQLIGRQNDHDERSIATTAVIRLREVEKGEDGEVRREGVKENLRHKFVKRWDRF